jgi:hypothetical protein
MDAGPKDAFTLKRVNICTKLYNQHPGSASVVFRSSGHVERKRISGSGAGEMTRAHPDIAISAYKGNQRRIFSIPEAASHCAASFLRAISLSVVF